MSNRAVFLYSGLATDQIQIVHTRRLESSLIGKKINFHKVDGSLSEAKEERDKLFAVSGHRGKYPQCFIEDCSSGVCRFVGLWEEIESLLDCDELPQEVLEANPAIQTFSKVFAECIAK